MRTRLLFALSVLSTPALLASCSSSESSVSEPVTGDDGGGPVADLDTYTTVPKSCACECPPESCAESKAPYACPALGAWGEIAHAEACPAWDGTYPAPQQGKCAASAPSGDAVKKTGPDPDDPATTILPDGRRVRVAGAEWRFDEAELLPGGPSLVVPMPGTPWLVVVDTGYGAHSVRVVDATKLGGGASPVVSYVKYDVPSALASAAVALPPDRVLVGTADGVVQAFTIDASGALAKDDARSVKLPPAVNDVEQPAPYAVGGLALSPDGKHLVVTPVFRAPVLVYDLEGSLSSPVGTLDIGKGGTFAAAFDPHDGSGRWLYATVWGGHAAIEIDLADPAAPKLARSFAIEKNPEGIAFLDGRWMAVANDLGDAIALVDRASGAVTELPVDAATPLHGTEPSSLAFDASSSRLYATLAAVNAVAAWDVDLGADPPKLTPAGRLATSWWPTSVATLPGGALAITTMRGRSGGPVDDAFSIADGDSMRGVGGTIQLAAAPSAADLASGEAASREQHDAGKLAGAPHVVCPEGVDDFPVPETNANGPSKVIDHVFVVLRENKTFDGVLGDLPGLDGDPSLTLKATTDDMERIWPNFRALARTFATSDNYYTSAEVSNQGHTWATFGRSSDFTERTWHLNGYSRSVWAAQVQPQGTTDIGIPLEGSIFDWMLDQGLSLDILGEAEGQPKPRGGRSAVDVHYPGGFVQSMGYPDVEKSCYAAVRARVKCDFGDVVFLTLPNDHTLGASPSRGSPETMVAVNDEATGAVVDAISHSPLWARSLVVITEDDPAQGGDHVDNHRTPIAFVSPWVKRGYVSKTHADVSSLYKLVAHLFGKPYPNEQVATAALPLDLFTSTPDYTPYAYRPRVWPAACGVAPTRAEARLAESWDFDDLDEQPGLDAQVRRLMRGAPLAELPPALLRQVEAREAARRRVAAGAPPRVRDDD